jgi:hypothetical protein
VHLAPDLAFRRPLASRPDPKTEGDVLEYRHVPEQGVMLKHESDLPFPYVAVGRILAVKQDRARIGCLQPRDDAQQGRLAAAGRPQERHQFAAADVQGNVLKSLESAEGFFHVVDFYAHIRVLLDFCRAA